MQWPATVARREVTLAQALWAVFCQSRGRSSKAALFFLGELFSTSSTRRLASLPAFHLLPAPQAEPELRNSPSIKHLTQRDRPWIIHPLYLKFLQAPRLQDVYRCWRLRTSHSRWWNSHLCGHRPLCCCKNPQASSTKSAQRLSCSLLFSCKFSPDCGPSTDSCDMRRASLTIVVPHYHGRHRS